MGRCFESARLAAPQVSAPAGPEPWAMEKEKRDQLQNLARKVSDPRVMAKSGRHKARRIILTENAGAVIERKLGWIK